jgi:hypothetical protein
MQKEGRKFTRMNSAKTGIDEEASLFNTQTKVEMLQEEEAEEVEKK